MNFTSSIAAAPNQPLHHDAQGALSALAERIPTTLLSRSGKVFYSGRKAFSDLANLYVLGVNPGGTPSEEPEESIGRHSDAVLSTFDEDWSAYRDESWEGAAPGTYGMAPRVLHLFTNLGLNPGSVPCSNLVFVRSRREGDIGKDINDLADLCWPFHALVVEKLRPRTILCFGKTAGSYVQKKVGANALVGEFVESNNRRWRSQTFANREGMKVVVATHPSIADWTVTPTDPTALVREAMT